MKKFTFFLVIIALLIFIISSNSSGGDHQVSFQPLEEQSALSPAGRIGIAPNTRQVHQDSAIPTPLTDSKPKLTPYKPEGWSTKS